MTQNSVSPISSSPWTGLGTQTYNVLTTGTYTCQVYCNIPWDATNTTAMLANPTSNTVQTVTLVADSSGSLNSTYWTFHNAGNTTGYYVWYNINSAGVDPAPAGLVGIPVAGATGASATTLATATAAAINAVTGNTATAAPTVYGPSFGTVVATAASGVVTLSNNQYGTETHAANSSGASPGFSYSVTTAGSFGTLSSGLVLQILNNGAVVQTVGNPTQSQPSMYLTQTMACTAGTTITMTASSLAPADQTPNAIHGLMNVYAGGL
jgi:hypothetical protein